MRNAIRPAFVGWALALLMVLSGGTAWSEDGEKKLEPVADHERDEAIQRGLRYLDDRVFKLHDAAGTPRKQFTVAVHGIDHLLADGRATRTDARGDVLRKARAYLLRYLGKVESRTADPAQLPAGPGVFSSDYIIQYTWPLAMSAFFFGELNARGKHKSEATHAIARIRALLLAAQDSSGGWGHHRLGTGKPARSGSMGSALGGGSYPGTLLSASFVVAASLGLVQPEKADIEPLARAVRYFRDSRLEGGNQPYDPSQRSAYHDMTGVSRAAGACFAWWTLGVSWRDKDMQSSLAWVDDKFDYLNEGHGSSTLNLLYGALLQKARGVQHWKRFKARYFRLILDHQDKDGAFACICEGKAFAATNDSDPFGGKGKGVVKRAGNMELLKGFMQNDTGCYVTALHTFILLLDREPPRIFGGDRPHLPKEAAKPPTTPR